MKSQSIEVSDLNFYQVEIGEYVECDILLQNVSENKKEEITVLKAYFGASHDSVKDNQTGLPQSSPFSLVGGFNDLPLVINSGGFYGFKIGFRPQSAQDYYDTIIFSCKTNYPEKAERQDTISLIKGKGVKAEIPHGSFDFGRRQINGGYLANISIKNIGFEKTKITGIKEVSGDSEELSIRNINLLKKYDLNTNDSFSLIVSYLPKKTGESRATYVLQTDKNYLQIKIELSGIGIKSVLFTEDKNLGLVEFYKERQAQIPFYISEDEFADSVTITELSIQSDSIIANNIVENDFKIMNLFSKKLQNIQLPYTLKLGDHDTLWASVLFTPKDTGNRIANIKAISSSTLEAVSNLVCRAEHTYLTWDVNHVENLCIPEEGLITAFVSNISKNLPVLVTSVALTGNIEKFEILDNEGSFTLAPSQTKQIRIKYKSLQEGSFNAALELYNTSTKTNQLKIKLQGSSVKYTTQSNIFSTKNSYNYLDTLSLLISTETNFATLNSKNLEIEVSYNPFTMRFVGIEQKNGIEVITNLIDSVLGKIVFNLKGDSNLHLSKNPILMRFVAKLTNIYTSEFTVNIASKDFTCVNFLESNFKAKLNVSYLSDTLDKNNYLICNPAPNPFSNNLLLKYIVPGSTHVKAYLYDLQGRIVYDIIDKIEQEGIHEINLNNSNLAEGTYFIKLWVGTYYRLFRVIKVHN